MKKFLRCSGIFNVVSIVRITPDHVRNLQLPESRGTQDIGSGQACEMRP